jgi:acetyl-CoA synthetase
MGTTSDIDLASPPMLRKPPLQVHALPNLGDYEKTRRDFSWDTAREELDGLPQGRGLNIAHEAIDRHADSAVADKLALRWLGRTGKVRDFTYRDLSTATARFANVLRNLGVDKGDRVFALSGRLPELYIAALGTLKNGSVFSPLFSAFGPEPIVARMTIGEGSVLVTTEALYKPRLPVFVTVCRHYGTSC